MKALKIFVFASLMAVCTILSPVHLFASEAVVYIDKIPSSAGSYTALSEAINALPDTGGTVVVKSSLTISYKEILPAKKVKITSLYSGVDYGKTGAKIVIKGVLLCGGETEFEDITIEGEGRIFACGNPLTIGKNVKTAGGTKPSLFGGNPDAVLTKDTRLSVNSGDWNIICGGGTAETKADSYLDFKAGTAIKIYGGNLNGSFTGNTYLIMTGGTVTNTVAGGNAPTGGSFYGETNLSITGGSVEYNSAGASVVGGSVGEQNGGATVFEGRINLTLGGSCNINNTIHGASRYPSVTTTAEINLTICGEAHLGRHVYGGGYGNVFAVGKGITAEIKENVTVSAPSGTSSFICAGANSNMVTGNLTMILRDGVIIPGNIYGGGYDGNVTGNSTVYLYDADIKVNCSAGSRSGKTTGNTAVYAYGGTVGYYSSSEFYGIPGQGGDNGKLTGTALVVVDGCDIAGAVKTTTGSADFTFTSGKIGSVLNNCKINIPEGKTLTIGGNINATELVCNGRLIISPNTTIRAAKASGNATLEISGIALEKHTAIIIDDISSTLNVRSALSGGADLIKEQKDNKINYTVSYADVINALVTIEYYNPEGGTTPKIKVYTGSSKEENKALIFSATDGTPFSATLSPGYYCFRIYYSESSDYVMKNIYLDDKTEALTYDFPFAPYKSNSYTEAVTMHTTDQVLRNFYGTDSLTGYTPQDTPTFTKHQNDRGFMTNEELCEYAASLAKECDYLYYFELSPAGEKNKMPLLIFTKDKIPQGSTEADIAKIATSKGTRDILFVTSGLHGNEPTGEEGVLGFAAELAGEYGSKALDSIAAIILIPASSPDNLMRFTRNNTDGTNPNRDFISAMHGNTQEIVRLYALFMPTFVIDCHEDNSGTNGINASDDSHSNIDDVCFDMACVPNAPLIDGAGIANKTAKLLNHKAFTEILPLCLERTAESGLRTGNYEWSYYAGAMSQLYGSVRGSYGLLIEVMRIWSGKSHYERAVFAMRKSLMTVTDIIVEQKGRLARDVAQARQAAAVIEYNPENLFITSMSRGGSGLSLTRLHPSVYLNGTYKDAAATVTRTKYDTVTASRSLPTGYVIPADLPKIEAIKEKLKQHGISYIMLKAGATLNLKEYTSKQTVKLGEVKEVTFEKGALIVLTDCSDVYLIAYLFEPDSYTASDTLSSLYQMNLIGEVDKLYRSEASNLRKLLGAEPDETAAPEETSIETTVLPNPDGEEPNETTSPEKPGAETTLLPNPDGTEPGETTSPEEPGAETTLLPNPDGTEPGETTSPEKPGAETTLLPNPNGTEPGESTASEEPLITDSTPSATTGDIEPEGKTDDNNKKPVIIISASIAAIAVAAGLVFLFKKKKQ